MVIQKKKKNKKNKKKKKEALTFTGKASGAVALDDLFNLYSYELQICDITVQEAFRLAVAYPSGNPRFYLGTPRGACIGSMLPGWWPMK